MEDSIEKYSVLRAQMAVERADVCVIMIDGVEGFTEQDSKVAGLAHDRGKGCIIAVNKWDAVEKDGKTMDQMRKKLMNDFSFMPYAPFVFLSAKTGQRVDRLFELIRFVAGQNAMRISTGMLNDVLATATARVQPPTDKGRRLKIYYMTQASTKPPTFVCFVNRRISFTFPISGIWKIRYVPSSVWRARRCASSSVKKAKKRNSPQKRRGGAAGPLPFFMPTAPAITAGTVYNQIHGHSNKKSRYPPRSCPPRRYKRFPDPLRRIPQWSDGWNPVRRYCRLETELPLP